MTMRPVPQGTGLGVVLLFGHVGVLECEKSGIGQLVVEFLVVAGFLARPYLRSLIGADPEIMLAAERCEGGEEFGLVVHRVSPS